MVHIESKLKAMLIKDLIEATNEYQNLNKQYVIFGSNFKFVNYARIFCQILTTYRMVMLTIPPITTAKYSEYYEENIPINSKD